MPPIGDTASAVQGALFFALRAWQNGHSTPGILRQDVVVFFLASHPLAPDISWWAHGRRSPHVHGHIAVIPDLLVEVLSPSTRENDLGPKRDLYIRSGVKELWLADPQSKTLTRVRPNIEDHQLATHHVLATDLLEGFSLDLRRVF